MNVTIDDIQQIPTDVEDQFTFAAWETVYDDSGTFDMGIMGYGDTPAAAVNDLNNNVEIGTAPEVPSIPKLVEYSDPLPSYLMTLGALDHLVMA